MIPGRLFTLASYCVNQKPGLTLLEDGPNSLFYFSIIIVSLHTFVLYSKADKLLVVMTKSREKDGITKYHVNRRVRLYYLGEESI